MNDELEKSLRSALRPGDPGEKFTQSVLARVAEESQAAGSRPRPYGALSSRPAFRWASATLAIVLTAGLFTAHQWQVHRTQQGLEARRQLFKALQVTGENLDIAYRMVNNQQPAGN
jgi:hypothetical protein